MKKNGVERTYHPNGQLESKTNWKDGELDGLYKEWYEDGTLAEEENWKNGKLIKALTQQKFNNRNNNIEALKTLGEALGYKVEIKEL